MSVRKALETLETIKLINDTTGEIVETYTQSKEKFTKRKEYYLKLYDNGLSILSNVGTIQFSVFFAILTLMNYDNIVTITNHEKNTIVELFNFKKERITRLIYHYVRLDLMRRVRNAVYMINPNIVSKAGHEETIILRKQYGAYPNEHISDSDDK